MYPPESISPSRQSSRSGGTTNVTVCPLVRSFKAFASYKYIYWQYSQSTTCSGYWLRVSESACTAAGKLSKTPAKFFSLLETRLQFCFFPVFLSSCRLKLDKSFSHHEAAAIFLLLTSQVTLLSNFASAHAQFNISNYAMFRNRTFRIKRAVSPASIKMSDPVCLVSRLQSCLQQSISKKYMGSSVSWWILSLFKISSLASSPDPFLLPSKGLGTRLIMIMVDWSINFLILQCRSWVCIKLVNLLSKYALPIHVIVYILWFPLQLSFWCDSCHCNVWAG